MFRALLIPILAAGTVDHHRRGLAQFRRERRDPAKRGYDCSAGIDHQHPARPGGGHQFAHREIRAVEFAQRAAGMARRGGETGHPVHAAAARDALHHTGDAERIECVRPGAAGYPAAAREQVLFSSGHDLHLTHCH